MKHSRRLMLEVVGKALRQPAIAAKLRFFAIEPAAMNRQQFTDFMREEFVRAKDWVKAAGIEPQ